MTKLIAQARHKQSREAALEETSFQTSAKSRQRVFCFPSEHIVAIQFAEDALHICSWTPLGNFRVPKTDFHSPEQLTNLFSQVLDPPLRS